MQEQTERGKSTIPNYRGWQSDVIVDLIKRYGFPQITLNPGASFRGLHDSLVNYGGNEPPMMLCNHEEIAVQIAHGYAKASGKPMAVILHNLVGLLHACMAIYYAYIDRVPIFIIGATGPMDEAKRRPHIDWTHSALVQGNAIRDYVKWDYQPTSIEGVPESFARAYSIMTTEPQGPVYMCYDAALQEEPLARAVPLPPAASAATPTVMAPDPKAIAAIADKLLAAEHPMLLAEYAGRRAGGFESIRGLGCQQRAQLPQQASAVPEHGQGVTPAHRPRDRARRQGLGKAAHRAQQRQAHPRADHPARLRFRRDRLRRGRHQQVGDGLLPHAAVLGARARRHRDRHPRAHPDLPGAHRQRQQAQVPHRRAQERDRQAPR
jgi:thiamine pyrophosphate-dependent acetolactate synthase large subunit-like protein